MQISTKHKFAFLCMPKCASTSIENAIRKHANINFTGDPRIKHINAQRFHRYIQAYLKAALPDRKIETFCLMREPLNWIHSWYRYRSRDELASKTHPEHANYTGHLSFEHFIEQLLAHPSKSFVRIGSQASFVRLSDGSVGIDRIFRMEAMEEVSRYLTAKIGVPIEIPVMNISPKSELVISSDLKDSIVKHFAKDYELYAKIP